MRMMVFRQCSTTACPRRGLILSTAVEFISYPRTLTSCWEITRGRVLIVAIGDTFHVQIFMAAYHAYITRSLVPVSRADESAPNQSLEPTAGRCDKVALI